jgi:hypothetical protein
LFLGRIQEFLTFQIEALDCAILPELKITIGATMGQNLTLLLQKILQCSSLVIEYTKVIAHNMAVLARGALNEDRAAVVSLL